MIEQSWRANDMDALVHYSAIRLANNWASEDVALYSVTVSLNRELCEMMPVKPIHPEHKKWTKFKCRISLSLSLSLSCCLRLAHT